MTARRIKELLRDIAPDIIFLMETKNNDESVLKSLNFLDVYSHVLVSLHSPEGGGLALFWKHEIELEVLFCCKDYIDTIIYFNGKKFFSTFVYGELDQQKRKPVWNELTNLSTNRDAPWFLTGDFNDIIDNAEKSGGPTRFEGSLGEFRAFLSQCDLYDLRHSGNYISWRGTRHHHLVFGRLDRAMSNSSWAETFPSGRCHYLYFEGSDHRPVVTYLEPTSPRKNKLFRYGRRMRNNLEITKIVKDVWLADPLASVEQRISDCRRVISLWNRKHHINSQKQIQMTRKRLEEAMSAPIADETLIENINKELRKAYSEEEEYWK